MRHGYREIPQFGQYVGEPHSVCFAKSLARPVLPAERAM